MLCAVVIKDTYTHLPLSYPSSSSGEWRPPKVHWPATATADGGGGGGDLVRPQEGAAERRKNGCASTGWTKSALVNTVPERVNFGAADSSTVVSTAADVISLSIHCQLQCECLCAGRRSQLVATTGRASWRGEEALGDSQFHITLSLAPNADDESELR